MNLIQFARVRSQLQIERPVAMFRVPAKGLTEHERSGWFALNVAHGLLSVVDAAETQP